MINEIVNFLGSPSLTWPLIYFAIAMSFVTIRVQSKVYYQFYELAGWQYNPNEI